MEKCFGNFYVLLEIQFRKIDISFYFQIVYFDDKNNRFK